MVGKEIIEGDIGREIVHDSCGCVFCDLDLEPEEPIPGAGLHHYVGDVKPHDFGGDWVPCTRNIQP